MNEADATLVLSWIRFHETQSCGHRSTSPEHSPDFYAVEALDSLSSTDPKRALEVIGDILFSTTNDVVLANLAAGPLEDLLVRHGSTVIDLIRARAQADVRFRRLLAGVWPNNIPSAIWSEIREIV